MAALHKMHQEFRQQKEVDQQRKDTLIATIQAFNSQIKSMSGQLQEQQEIENAAKEDCEMLLIENKSIKRQLDLAEEANCKRKQSNVKFQQKLEAEQPFRVTMNDNFKMANETLIEESENALKRYEEVNAMNMQEADNFSRYIIDNEQELQALQNEQRDLEAKTSQLEEVLAAKNNTLENLKLENDQDLKLIQDEKLAIVKQIEEVLGKREQEDRENIELMSKLQEDLNDLLERKSQACGAVKAAETRCIQLNADIAKLKERQMFVEEKTRICEDIINAAEASFESENNEIAHFKSAIEEKQLSLVQSQNNFDFVRKQAKALQEELCIFEAIHCNNAFEVDDEIERYSAKKADLIEKNNSAASNDELRANCIDEIASLTNETVLWEAQVENAKVKQSSLENEMLSELKTLEASADEKQNEYVNKKAENHKMFNEMTKLKWQLYRATRPQQNKFAALNIADTSTSQSTIASPTPTAKRN